MSRRDKAVRILLQLAAYFFVALAVGLTREPWRSMSDAALGRTIAVHLSEVVIAGLLFEAKRRFDLHLARQR